jgi:hypothetical protein
MHRHAYSGHISTSHTMSRNRSQIWVRAMGKVANVSSSSFPELKSAINLRNLRFEKKNMRNLRFEMK